MTRDFRVNGPSLVKIKGGAHLTNSGLFGLDFTKSVELGLALGNIRISPTFHRQDMRTDDFGPDASPDVQSNLAHVTISMTLVHVDDGVLSLCVQEGMAKAGLGPTLAGDFLDGVAAGAGTPMGKGLPMFSSGNNLISLNILSEDEENPWRFRSCYLADNPFTYPLGTKNSEVILTWTAIPYAPLFVPTALSGNIGPPLLVLQQFAVSGAGNFQELSSSGVVIWDHTTDDMIDSSGQ